MLRADQNPQRVFYLMAPNYMASPELHIVNYCKGASTSAVYNTYERAATGWLKIPYDPITPRPWQPSATHCVAE